MNAKWGVFYLAVCTQLWGCCCRSHTAQEMRVLNQKIDSLKQVYAPDTRVVLWEIALLKDKQGPYIHGTTNLPAAHRALRALDVRDSVQIWPNKTALSGMLWGVVHNSVANLRKNCSHSSELVTQALLGTPLRILGKQGKTWYFVQTPDKYLAWIDVGGFTRMDSLTFTAWQQEKKLFYKQTEGYAYTSASEQEVVSDMVMGCIISRTGRSKNRHEEVHYPDGRRAWLRKNELYDLTEKSATGTHYDGAALVTHVPNMLGLPYLWGGTSVKGIDCSGFIKTLFFMEGWIIPRDASQQAKEGVEVDTTRDWDKLQAGDLLFFGRKEKNPTRTTVTHVGMWLAAGRFVHASGRVRISSTLHTDDSYNAQDIAQYLFSRRYKAPTKQLIPYLQAGIYYRPK